MTTHAPPGMKPAGGREAAAGEEEPPRARGLGTEAGRDAAIEALEPVDEGDLLYALD